MTDAIWACTDLIAVAIAKMQGATEITIELLRAAQAFNYGFSSAFVARVLQRRIEQRD